MKKLLTYVVLFALIGTSYAQRYSVSNKKAIKKFEASRFQVLSFQYKAGINGLKELLAEYPDFGEVYQVMGDAYFDQNDFDEAKSCFAKAVTYPQNEKHVDQDNIKLAFIAAKTQHKEDLDQNLLQNLPSSGSRSTMANKITAAAKFDESEVTRSFKVTKLPSVINQFKEISHPSVVDDQLVFSAMIANEKGHENEDIVITKKVDGEWLYPVRMPESISSNKNEGGASFSEFGDVMVFSVYHGKDGLGDCDLYISKQIKGHWNAPEHLGPVINSIYWEGDPYLANNGESLFFSSNRPGGQGHKDIYVCHHRNGNWTQPLNLGATINSPLSEVSPMYDLDSKQLTFASNGHPGFGGYDIFLSNGEAQRWSQPQNYGHGVNTVQDENGLYVDYAFMDGYFTRKENGTSSLYTFNAEAVSGAPQSAMLSGRILDKQTKKPISAIVKVFEKESGSQVKELWSDDETGTFRIKLDKDEDYTIYFKRKGYLYATQDVHSDMLGILNNITSEIKMLPIKKDAKLVTKNITFPTGKYELKNESKTELMVIVHLLESNPELHIEIGGHTDNVGSTKANQQLSLNRAKSVDEFLSDQGISTGRIQHKGYGPSQPVATNDNEGGRAKNRRIELKVL